MWPGGGRFISIPHFGGLKAVLCVKCVSLKCIDYVKNKVKAPIQKIFSLKYFWSEKIKTSHCSHHLDKWIMDTQKTINKKGVDLRMKMHSLSMLQFWSDSFFHSYKTHWTFTKIVIHMGPERTESHKTINLCRPTIYTTKPKYKCRQQK